jgi:hypothetical protein
LIVEALHPQSDRSRHRSAAGFAPVTRVVSTRGLTAIRLETPSNIYQVTHFAFSGVFVEMPVKLTRQRLAGLPQLTPLQHRAAFVHPI